MGFHNQRGGGASILVEPFVFEEHISSQNAHNIQPGHSQHSRMMCCPPCVAAASGRAEGDTWPLVRVGCYHMTEVGGPVCETHIVSVELLKVYIQEVSGLVLVL